MSIQKSSNAVVTICMVIILALLLSSGNQTEAAPSLTIKVVTSTWELDEDLDKVRVAAEIENTSGQYLENVAVRAILVSATENEIEIETGAAFKEYLSPGERTFFTDTIYTDSAYLTTSVTFTSFGDLSDAQTYPYLDDPDPLYIESEVDGGTVYYFGEFENRSGKMWFSECAFCSAVNAIGAYYENGQLIDYSTLGTRPHGHIGPGGRLAFRYYFDRAPNGSFKLFTRTTSMNPGDFPTSWKVEALQWYLEDGTFSKEIAIDASFRNMSDIRAEPDIWFVARDASGKWIGWTSCLKTSEVQPGETITCEEDLLSINMHAGTVEDVVTIEPLVASDAITSENPYAQARLHLPYISHVGNAVPPNPTATRTLEPELTPTATVTLQPANTVAPTSTPQPTNTAIPTSTVGPTSTPTATATTAPDSVSVLANHSAYTTNSDTLYLVGEVKNNTSDHLRFVKVSANLYDQEGQLLDTSFTYTWLDSLPPDDKSCFDILFLDAPTNWKEYEFEEVEYWTDAEPLPSLTILNDSGTYVTPYGWYEIIGQVRNDENSAIESVSVVGTLYDASSSVIGCDFTFPNNSDLSPDQTSSFEMLFLGRDYSDAASYRLQADGNSPAHLRWLLSRMHTD